MGWRRRGSSPTRCNDVERMLRSTRACDEIVPVLWPGMGSRRADQALSDAAARLGEAQRLLAPYRAADDTSDLGRVYAAVHDARGGITASRHWRALEVMASTSKVPRSG